MVFTSQNTNQLNNQIPIAEDDDVEFLDAESYRPPEHGALSYEQLVLEQIKRCVVEGSKEMIGGYMQQKVTQRGIIEIYVPDQRAVYIQCIDSLYDILLSFFDDEMWNAVDNFKKDMEDAKERKLSILRDKLVATKDNRLKQQLKLQVETKFIDRESAEARALLDEKIDIYRELFEELLLLYSRKRYLMAQSIEA